MDIRKSLQCNTPPSITYYGFLLVKKLDGTTVCGRFPVIKKEVTIGRDNGCDIRILLDSVSAVHCSIYYINDKAYIREKSISATTKVNDKKIGKSNFLLNHSDEIEISGRKFVWEYANSFTDYTMSGKKTLLKNESTIPKVTEQQLSAQVTDSMTSQDSNNQCTPAKSGMKTPSKTLISYNKTPIVVAATNISEWSYNELKKNIKRRNSTTISQSEPRRLKLVPGRNIPLIGGTKSTQRKSWTTTTNNISGNSTSNATSILDQLSSDRLKRDSTPEFNYSYHYADDSVQFDSPEPACVIPDDNQAINILPEFENQNSNDSQFTNNLTVSEPDLSSSRRDTYSINDSSIKIEQINTPAPGRSILKGSKTAKATRSSCRMVKFARLPYTDGKIKTSKGHFNSKPNFTVSDGETNEVDCSLDSKKSMQSDIEDLDDDLDGVQPLDSSVSSLMNSPILDNSSFKKSSKRGSRGNKVMSLINSIEKQRNNESPKNSIRASDLLSVNRSKHENVSLNGSQNNASKLEESVSSTRRINLENIFEFEDSSKDATCIIENETKTPTKECLAQGENNKDESLEQDYKFASPLNLHCVNNTSNTSLVDHSTLEESTENESMKMIVDHLESETSTSKVNKSASATPVNKHLRSSDINTSSSVNVKNTSMNHNNSSKTQRIHSACFEQTTENEKQINETALVQEPSVKVKNSAQKDNAKIIKNDQLDMSNAGSKVVDAINYEESPSMIIQGMSEMFNSSDHMSTCTQPDNSLLDTYVVVDNDDLPKSPEKCKLRNTSKHRTINESMGSNKSVVSTNDSTRNMVTDIIDSIKEQLDVLHDLDAFSKTSNNESIEQRKTSVSSSAAKVSKLNESTENILGSVSKTKTMCSNVGINDLNNVENFNESEIPMKDTVSVLNKSSTKNSSTMPIVSNDLTNAEKENEVQTKSKQMNKSAQSTLRSSSIVSNIVDNAIKNELCSVKPTRKILKVIDWSTYESSDDNEMELVEYIDKEQINSNIENTLDTSIGKPRYESTPWSSSKSSKTKFNSSIMPANDTSSTNGQIKERSCSPLPEPDVWYQMMKDFNESVKKASVSDNNTSDVCTITKNLFNNEQNACPTLQVTAVEEMFSNKTNVENSLLTNEVKNNTIQCSLISSCLLPNSTIKTKQQFSRSNNSSLRKSSRSNKLSTNSIEEIEVNTPKSTLNDVSAVKNNSIDNNSKDESKKIVLNNTSSDIKKPKLATTREPNDLEHNTISDDISDSSSLISLDKTNKVGRTRKINSNPVSFSRRRLRTKVNNNVSTKKKVSVKVIAESTLTSSDIDDSTSVLQTSGKKLHCKLNIENETVVNDNDMCPSSTTSQKSIETTSSKTKLTEKIINPAKTRLTRSGTSLTELCVPKLIKNNKTLSPIKTKSVKVDKTKKTKNSKSNQKTQPKRVLSSNPVKAESYLSENKSEDSTSESLLVDGASKEKVKKENLQLIHVPTTRNRNKKDVDVMNPQLIDPTKNKEKGKKKNIQSDDSSSISSKRTKKEKNDDFTPKISSPLRTRSRKRPADTPVSQPIAKGPKRDASSKASNIAISLVTHSPKSQLLSDKKFTQTSSKITVSFTETTIKKEKSLTRAKKREISSESSCDSAPTARKMTRRQANVQEIEVKKSTSNTRATSSSDRDSAPSVRKMTRRQANVQEIEVKKSTTNTRATSSSDRDSAPSARKMTRRQANVKETEKKKFITTSRATSSSDCDSASSARKMTRRQANVQETEKKKLTTTTRATSKTKDQHFDESTNNHSRVRFEPNVAEKFISPKPKKTRSTTTVAKAKNVSPSPPPPRVLRTREKKK